MKNTVKISEILKTSHYDYKMWIDHSIYKNELHMKIRLSYSKERKYTFPIRVKGVSLNQ